jgi:hypothetical protein
MTYGEALAILGLDMAATRSQWKSAYVRLSRFWDQTTNHAGIAPTMYRQVRVAYRYLLDHPAPGPAGPPGATGPAGADGTDGQDGEDGTAPPP